MATYFAFFSRYNPLFLPKKHSYLTHLLKYESQFYNLTQVIKYLDWKSYVRLRANVTTFSFSIMGFSC